MTEHQPLFDAIAGGQLDRVLFELEEAVKQRRNIVTSREYGGFKPDDIVRFKETTRPAKLAGRQAKVIHTNGRGRNRIVVDLLQPTGNWNTGIRCQPSHLELISA